MHLQISVKKTFILDKVLPSTVDSWVSWRSPSVGRAHGARRAWIRLLESLADFLYSGISGSNSRSRRKTLHQGKEEEKEVERECLGEKRRTAEGFFVFHRALGRIWARVRLLFCLQQSVRDWTETKPLLLCLLCINSIVTRACVQSSQSRAGSPCSDDQKKHSHPSCVLRESRLMPTVMVTDGGCSSSVKACRAPFWLELFWFLIRLGCIWAVLSVQTFLYVGLMLQHILGMLWLINPAKHLAVLLLIITWLEF